MQIITEQKALAAFCKQVADGHYITVDTEFIREKTYYPKLCLIQIAGAAGAAIIDPLAEGIDLAPVFALFENKNLTKVFHACRQDIEIFFGLTGKIPAPVFDTQVAAAVCGYGESASYESLVNKIVGAEIDKSSRFTDWAARPLSEKQLAYALSDVTHLCIIYEDLKTKIEAMGRASWIEEDHAFLTDPALYQPDPRDSWKRLKYGNMRPKGLAILRELAHWRELEAREADVPRGRIVRDEALIELAHTAPRKEADIARLRNLSGGISKSRLPAIFECVEKALALPSSEYPHVSKHRRSGENVTAAVAMLQLLLRVKSDEHGIAPSIIAGKDELESLALGETELPILHGWRFEIFGKSATSLMSGNLKLSLNPKNKKMVLEEI